MTYKKIGLIGYGNVGKTLIDQLSVVDPTGTKFVLSAIGSRSLGLIELESIPSRSVTAQIDELKRIDDALHRISNGEYGFCVDCGKPISNVRLETFPYAARCIICQEALESS